MANITTYSHVIKTGARVIQPTLGEYYEFTLPKNNTNFHISFIGIPSGLYLFIPWSCGDTFDGIYEVSYREKWGLSECEGVDIYNGVSQFIKYSDAASLYEGCGFNILRLSYTSDANFGINMHFTDGLNVNMEFRLFKLFDL